MFEITGDEPDERDPSKKRTEVVELWSRDPVECVRELIGNPAFRDHVRYSPERLYKDKDGKDQVFDETWTGEWWWKVQVSGCVLPLLYIPKSHARLSTEGLAAGRYCRTHYTSIRQDTFIKLQWG
jgi:Plavaka transposase